MTITDHKLVLFKLLTTQKHSRDNRETPKIEPRETIEKHSKINEDTKKKDPRNT